MQKNDGRTIGGTGLGVADRTPASICFTEANDVFVPGLIAGSFVLLGCAFTEPIIPS